MGGKAKSRKLIPGMNDLATTHPEVLNLWDFSKNTLQPDELTYGSDVKVFWKCILEHSWESMPKEITRGRKCPYCTNKKILKGFNDLATKKPELLKFWDFEKNALSPHEIGIGSGRKSWWICELGHSWNTVIRYVVEGARCPFCSSNKLLKGFNDLNTKFPEIAKEWNFAKNRNTKPTDVFAGSSKSFWWICQKDGYEWKAEISNRTGSNQGCPSCARSYITSQVEKDLREFIQEIYSFSIVPNCRQVIQGKELDIYLPDAQIAIEFNGLYWHSEEIKKSPNYHYDKWKSCAENDVFLVQIWEDDWRDKNTAVKNRLSNSLLMFKSELTYEILKMQRSELLKDFLQKYSFVDFSEENEYLLVLDETDSIKAIMAYKIENTICRILDYTSLSADISIFTSFANYIKNTQDLQIIEYFDDNCFSSSLLLVDSGFSVDRSISVSFWNVIKGCRVRQLECNENSAYKKSSRIFDAGMTRYVLNG